MAKKASVVQVVATPIDEPSVSKEVRKILEQDISTSPSEIVKLLIAQHPSFAGKEKTIASTASSIRTKMSGGGKPKQEAKQSVNEDLQANYKLALLVMKNGGIEKTRKDLENFKGGTLVEIILNAGGVNSALERLADFEVE